MASSAITIKECTKTSSRWTGHIGLLRHGEMFASQLGSGKETSSSMWLITPRDSIFGTVMYDFGGASYESPSGYMVDDDIGYEGDVYAAARPTIHLSSAVKITGGTGLFEDPFEISL